MTFRSVLYRAARFRGDVDAAAKGPDALAKRLLRRRIYRKANGLLGRALRKGGL